MHKTENIDNVKKWKLVKGQGRKQDINLNFKVIFGNTRGEQRGAGIGDISNIEESRGELVGDISNMKIKI